MVDKMLRIGVIIVAVILSLATFIVLKNSVLKKAEFMPSHVFHGEGMEVGDDVTALTNKIKPSMKARIGTKVRIELLSGTHKIVKSDEYAFYVEVKDRTQIFAGLSGAKVESTFTLFRVTGHVSGVTREGLLRVVYAN
jgi:hypothetical protein